MLLPDDLTEKAILEDIRKRTGLSFAHLAGIDTRNKAIADAVLPLLAEWRNLAGKPNFRHAIYSRFLTPHAHSYINCLLQWWQAERDVLASGCLAQVLAMNVGPSDADRVWEICKNNTAIPFYFMLAASLTKFPSIGTEAKQALVDALRGPVLSIADLQYIAEVQDFRIRKWFEGHLDAPNPRLRAMAERVTRRNEPLEPLSTSPLPPNRDLEVFSTEIDLDAIDASLQEVAAKFSIRFPKGMQGTNFLASLELNEWRSVYVTNRDGVPFVVWFRMEDLDTVEVVVTAEHVEKTTLI